jgi:hypothetical protein
MQQHLSDRASRVGRFFINYLDSACFFVDIHFLRSPFQDNWARTQLIIAALVIAPD